MELIETGFEGLKLIKFKVFSDDRGYFVERFNKAKFAEFGLPTDFAQDNCSYSLPNVIRGLHYQTDPAQSKFVSVIKGKIWDVAVDIRPNSKTFGKYYAAELSEENGLALWVPNGFAHGFAVLGDDPAYVTYKVDGLYNPKTDAGIRFDDPKLNIDWPTKNPIISSRDKALPAFAGYN